MKKLQLKNTRMSVMGMLAISALSASLVPATANAISLSAASGGTVTLSFDADVFATFQGGSTTTPGMFNDHFYNTAASNPTTYTGSALNVLGDNAAESSNALVHDIMPVGPNPAGQQPGRGVKGTTTNFAINSDTLTAPTSSLMGMTGVQELGIGVGIFAGTSIVVGDYALRYNQALRQSAWDDAGSTATSTGWYLFNNLDIPSASYDLGTLVLAFDDANNWQLSGDLLLGPELAAFYVGNLLQDVGNFCVGVGSYSGCNIPVETSAVPVPGAVWLFGGALSALFGAVRKKSVLPA